MKIAPFPDECERFTFEKYKCMWPNSDETQELIIKAKRSPEEIDQLLMRYQSALHRLVELRLDRKIRHRIDVSDILQETFLEANRRMQNYLEDQPLPLHLWLRQIAMDRVIDAHRRHRGSAMRSVDKEEGMMPGNAWDQSTQHLVRQISDPQLTPATEAMQRELAKRVEDAISSLGDQDAEIILMRHYEHLTNQDVAITLGLTEPAASMRYLRALRKLKTILEGEGESGPE